LVCSIFTAVCFIYGLLKSSTESMDWCLCYYILCVFLPFVLLCTYNIERCKSLSNGDSRHIAMLQDIAPVRLLVFLSIVDISLATAGYILGIKLLPILNIASFIPIFISWCFLFSQKKQLVTTLDRFVISSNSKHNFALHVIIAGTMLLPVSFAKSFLVVGFSLEFELSVAIIVGVVLLYVFFKIISSDSIESKINEVIDGYLYKNWSKSKSLIVLEQSLLGKRPTDELNMLSKQLELFNDEISEHFNLFERYECSLPTVILNSVEYNIFMTEVKNAQLLLQNFKDFKKDILEKTERLLKVKTLEKDDDFLKLVKNLRNSQELDMIDESASKLDKKISICIKLYQTECE